MTPWNMYEVVLLALTIWREARGEHDDAKIAVGCCFRNRVHKPGWWGTDFATVLTKKWQVSSLTAPGDSQLVAWPSLDDATWERCLDIASQVFDEVVNHPFPGADSYFDDSIAPPTWATPDKCVGRIGRLRFYNLDGDHEVAA